MAKYEIWGRQEIGKGKRRKLAYEIESESEAKRIRQDFISQGFRDCVVCDGPVSYAPGLVIGKRRRQK